MNKNETIEALYGGKKIRHNYFDDNEWMIMDDSGRIVFEDGCSYTVDEFWYDRRSPVWEDGCPGLGDLDLEEFRDCTDSGICTLESDI